MNRLRWGLLFSAVFLMTGCVHVISSDLRGKASPPLSLIQVAKNPEAYKGKWVVWGGEIIETINQQNETTEIEIFQKPLGWNDEPKLTPASEGRFLVLADQYLDPYLYRKGRRITIAGEIAGEKIKLLGQMNYKYPLISASQIYFWQEYYYPPYPYYYYDPWWPGYPYGAWGGGFYYYHHRR
jgi:outer membrane lipoprotein